MLKKKKQTQINSKNGYKSKSLNQRNVNKSSRRVNVIPFFFKSWQTFIWYRIKLSFFKIDIFVIISYACYANLFLTSTSQSMIENNIKWFTMWINYHLLKCCHCYHLTHCIQISCIMYSFSQVIYFKQLEIHTETHTYIHKK